jgi:hypothetical protein
VTCPVSGPAVDTAVRAAHRECDPPYHHSHSYPTGGAPGNVSLGPITPFPGKVHQHSSNRSSTLIAAQTAGNILRKHMSFGFDQCLDTMYAYPRAHTKMFQQSSSAARSPSPGKVDPGRSAYQQRLPHLMLIRPCPSTFSSLCLRGRSPDLQECPWHDWPTSRSQSVFRARFHSRRSCRQPHHAPPSRGFEHPQFKMRRYFLKADAFQDCPQAA